MATIYSELNQYHVILGVAPKYMRSPDALKDIYVPSRGTSSSGSAAASTPSTGTATTAGGSASATAAAPTSAASGPINPALRDQATGQAVNTTAATMVPLSAIARFSERPTASSISHQDAELATTISYNLAEGSNLADSEKAVRQAEAEIGMPINVRGSFQGTARAAQDSQKEQPMLIALAIVVIYIVLGVLYESLVHPVTVLSTLPSAGVGAVLALLIFRMDLSIIALIGLFLLIGIVKKNAILIIDFALDAERSRGLSPVCGGARGLPAALPAHPHDDAGRGPGRAAAGHRLRRRRGTAPAAGHHHHRRPDRQPGDHAAHHAGRLSAAGQAAPAQSRWSASWAGTSSPARSRKHP